MSTSRSIFAACIVAAVQGVKLTVPPTAVDSASEVTPTEDGFVVDLLDGESFPEVIPPMIEYPDDFFDPPAEPELSEDEEEEEDCEVLDCCEGTKSPYEQQQVAFEATDKIADEIAQEIADQEDLTVEETLDVKIEIEKDILINLEHAIDEQPSLVDDLPEELAT